MIATKALGGAASSTIEKHWAALRAAHTAAGKMNFWMSERGSHRAMKSFASLRDSRRHRSERGAISSEEFEDLAQCAIKSGRPHLAVGYYLLMFGLLRHNHIGRALVGDATFTIDKRTIRVTSWGYETKAERHKEQVHHFPCPADIICSYIKGKQLERHDLLLPEWNAEEAVRFIKAWALLRKKPDNLQYDVHMLRHSGAAYYRELPPPTVFIARLGVWSESSKIMDEIYARQASSLDLGPNDPSLPVEVTVESKSTKRKLTPVAEVALQLRADIYEQNHSRGASFWQVAENMWRADTRPFEVCGWSNRMPDLYKGLESSRVAAARDPHSARLELTVASQKETSTELTAAAAEEAMRAAVASGTKLFLAVVFNASDSPLVKFWVGQPELDSDDELYIGYE